MLSFSKHLICYLNWFNALRAGELSAAELENLMVIVANPRQFKIPDWFLNRKKDYKDGRYSQVVSNALDMKLRDDLERLKKIRLLFPMLSLMIILFEHRSRSLSCYMNPLVSVNLQHFSYVSWILVMLLLAGSMFSLSLYSSFVLSSYDWLNNCLFVTMWEKKVILISVSACARSFSKKMCYGWKVANDGNLFVQ